MDAFEPPTNWLPTMVGPLPAQFDPKAGPGRLKLSNGPLGAVVAVGVDVGVFVAVAVEVGVGVFVAVAVSVEVGVGVFVAVVVSVEFGVGVFVAVAVVVEVGIGVGVFVAVAVVVEVGIGVFVAVAVGVGVGSVSESLYSAKTSPSLNGLSKIFTSSSAPLKKFASCGFSARPRPNDR